jgi:DNA uptake protein ComE-like DNA-binding protein
MPGDVSGRRLMAFACALLAVASVAATPAPPSAPSTADHAFSASSKATPTKPVAPVDINSASPAQLKTLPGIGDAEAARIVASRPYLSKADLATKGVVPTGVYLSLKDRVIAIQKPMPKKVAAAP